MKFFSAILLAAGLIIPAFAEDAKTNAAAVSGPPLQTFPASAAVVTVPLALTNGCLALTGEQAEVTGGGKAVFAFTITNAGSYVFEASVSAPGEDANSFYLNVDAPPEDPGMIWDIEVTTGFEKRTANWRGDGSDTSDQFAPKRFKLSPGAHQLIIVGREPGVQLKTVSLRPVPPE